MVVQICSSNWLLAVKSLGLSQAEKIKTVAKDEQIKTITITFTQTDKF